MSRRGENIYKRKDGRWEGRYIKSYTADNKAQYGYVYTGRILAVGIAYRKDDPEKKHECKVEVLRERIL